MLDASEPFQVLRLVLCTQPRSNPIAFGGSGKLRPLISLPALSHFNIFVFTKCFYSHSIAVGTVRLEARPVHLIAHLPNGRRAIGSLDSELWNVARRRRHRPLVAQRNNTNGQTVEWNSWSVGGACGRGHIRIPVVRPETFQRGGFHMAIGTTDIHPAVPQRHCATSHPHC